MIMLGAALGRIRFCLTFALILIWVDGTFVQEDRLLEERNWAWAGGSPLANGCHACAALVASLASCDHAAYSTSVAMVREPPSTATVLGLRCHPILF